MTASRRTVLMLLVLSAIWLAFAVVLLAQGQVSRAAFLLLIVAAFVCGAATSHLSATPSRDVPISVAAFRLRGNLFVLAAVVWLSAVVLELINGSILAVLLVIPTVLYSLAGVGSRRALRSGTVGQPRQQLGTPVEAAGRTGEDYPIVSVHTLLRQLGLQSASKHEQVAGVRAWLVDHEPGPALRTSFERNGFTAALP